HWTTVEGDRFLLATGDLCIRNDAGGGVDQRTRSGVFEGPRVGRGSGCGAAVGPQCPFDHEAVPFGLAMYFEVLTVPVRDAVQRNQPVAVHNLGKVAFLSIKDGSQ